MSKSPFTHLVPLILIYFATRSLALGNNQTQVKLTSKIFEYEATLTDPETVARESSNEKISPRYPTHSKKSQTTLRIKSTGDQEEMSVVDYSKDANFTRECNRGSQLELKMNNGSYKNTSSSFNLREKRSYGFKMTYADVSPYSVLVVPLSKGFRPKRFCTGSLLTYKWVLTAAHCFKDREAVGHTQVVVYAGGNSYNEVVRKKYAPGSQRSYAQRKNILIHPYFRFGDYFCDVALIRMDKTFRETNTVRTIPISAKWWDYSEYETCRVVGFGTLPIPGTRPAEGERKENKVEVKRPCTCFPGSNIICHQPEHNDGHCTGDCLGAALVCQGEIRGIVSYGITFTDVSACKYTGPSLLKCGWAPIMPLFIPTCNYVDWINSYVKLFKEIPQECKKWKFHRVNESLETSSSTRPALAILWLWITLIFLEL